MTSCCLLRSNTFEQKGVVSVSKVQRGLNVVYVSLSSIPITQVMIKVTLTYLTCVKITTLTNRCYHFCIVIAFTTTCLFYCGNSILHMLVLVRNSVRVFGRTKQHYLMMKVIDDSMVFDSFLRSQWYL